MAARKDSVEELIKTLTKRVDELEKQHHRAPSGSWINAIAILVLAVMAGLFYSGYIQFNTCGQLQLQRYGERRSYTGPFDSNRCRAEIRHIIDFANNEFHPTTKNVTRIVTADGKAITAPVEFSSDVVVTALSAPDKEHFFVPTLNIGESMHVDIGGRNVEIKTLATNPRIYEITNILSIEECDHLLELAKSKIHVMIESKVGSSDEDSQRNTQVRTSRQTWIGKHVTKSGTLDGWESSDIVEAVDARLLQLTHLPRDLAEPFQVVFYNQSDYYWAHHDYVPPYSAPNNPYYQGGGNRLVTILLYLNDVEEGGHTVFPFVSPAGEPINRHVEPTTFYEKPQVCDLPVLKVKPRKGGAIMFYNLLENGHMAGALDVYTVHAGCKPLKGEKFIANKWIRNKRVNGNLYDGNW